MDTIAYDHWFTPAELIALTDRVGAQLAETCDIRSQIGKPYREAWIAARFAAMRGAQAVRLIGEKHWQTPDFAIHLDNRTLLFENTEADDPTRQRNRDYLDACHLFLSQADYAVLGPGPVAPELYAQEIARLVAKKCAKHYARCDGLVLLSHAAWIAGMPTPPQSWWEAACAEAQTHFPEVWIFHDRAFQRLFVEAQTPVSVPPTDTAATLPPTQTSSPSRLT
ncbi:hypothetical protein [Novosphingobium rosa]|uniref:hypothetical protein n=1 Tax=Novosphingobium rosa TaxID=76978 RepID=UPI00082BC025|nr:hypothetical protein [Novosphingobium rosa]